MAGRTIVDGYYFANEADMDLAQQEVARIKQIAAKMNMTNAQGVLAAYDKLISSGVFVTPIGLEYLRTLQNYLYKNPEISDELVRDIPIAISYSDALSDRQALREAEMERKAATRTLRKTFRREYTISLWGNIILIIMVVAMFFIALRSDTPNMLNYRTAIENEYAEWGQEISDREEIVRAKERELSDMGIEFSVDAKQ